jgi:selenium metabolism protein YedF
MSKEINAKKLACPEPVIRTKKALQEYDDVAVTVDNTTAVENIKRLASSMNCSVDIKEEGSGSYRLRLVKKGGAVSNTDPDYLSCNTAGNVSGPTVITFTSDVMGKGNDELGSVLIKAFIHTVTELEKLPDVMIFYNTGVKLIAEGSPVIEDIKAIEKRGVKVLACGTCLNFFNLKEKLGAGIVSNMYDIAGTLTTAGRIVIP